MNGESQIKVTVRLKLSSSELSFQLKPQREQLNGLNLRVCLDGWNKRKAQTTAKILKLRNS